jgi:hypothetical protein
MRRAPEQPWRPRSGRRRPSAAGTSGLRNAGGARRSAEALVASLELAPAASARCANASRGDAAAEGAQLAARCCTMTSPLALRSSARSSARHSRAASVSSPTCGEPPTPASLASRRRPRVQSCQGFRERCEAQQPTKKPHAAATRQALISSWARPENSPNAGHESRVRRPRRRGVSACELERRVSATGL